MGRNIKAVDPRKHLIVRALKIKSGGTRVTLLTEESPGVFKGHCQRQQMKVDSAGFAHPTGGWDSLGFFEVTAEEAKIPVVKRGIMLYGPQGTGTTKIDPRKVESALDAMDEVEKMAEFFKEGK